MTILGKQMEEVLTFQAEIKVLLEQLYNRSSYEPQQAGAASQQNSHFVDTFFFPINTLDDVLALENALKDPMYKQYLVKLLYLILM